MIIDAESYACSARGACSGNNRKPYLFQAEEKRMIKPTSNKSLVPNRMGSKREWHKFVWAAVILFFLPLPSADLWFHLLPNLAYERLFDTFYVVCFVSAFLMLIKGNKILKKRRIEANAESERQ